MFKKKQKKTGNEDVQNEYCIDTLEPYKQPMVFLFDVEEAVEKELQKLRINYFTGSFGVNVKVNNNRHDEKLLKLNYDYPSNLHEFDIVLMDLTSNRTENYVPEKHQLGNASGTTAHALLSTYPEQIFDPRPLSIGIVSRDINEIFEKKSIIIVFCGNERKAEYQFVEITDRGARVTGRETHSNYSFYSSIPSHRSRHGIKVVLPQKESKLSPLFLKYLEKISYNAVFYHPTVWSDGKNREIDEFVPLLFNDRGEIVSYAHFIQESIIFVFPDVEDKPGFISDLFKTHLPDISPDIFPFHGEFKWLDGGDYPLPGEKQLLHERTKLEEQYKNDIADNEMALAALKGKYKFLSDLISETGSTLVSAVESYLKWLEFDSVVNLDDTNPELLEEDIQVDCGDRFLVVEIKGLGGTSTDKDCAQVSKIKYRRAEQRGQFDVYGLYIVNHQRYMPPKSRSNPPFTDIQVKDAELDKRGLLTAYELYKAYFLINEGILNKNDVREALFKTGLICLEPVGLVSLGIAEELYMDGQVAILNISAIKINVGDTLIVKKQDEYFSAAIESLQIDGKDVQSCDEGEVGVKLNTRLRKNSEIFIKKV